MMFTEVPGSSIAQVHISKQIGPSTIQKEMV